MAITKDTRPKKVKEIYNTLEALIMDTEDVEELTMLSVVMLISARTIMMANHGALKTQAILEQMRDEIVLQKNLPKPIE